MKMSNISFRSFLYPFLFALTAGITLPFTTYFYNLDEFNIAGSYVLYSSFSYFFVTFIIFSAPILLGQKARAFITTLCLFLTGYILICTFFFPIQVGLVDGASHELKASKFFGVDFEWIKFAGIWTGMTAGYFLNKSLFRDLVLFGAAASILMLMYTVGDTVAQGKFFKEEDTSDNKSKSTMIDEFTKLSSDENILIISFDGLQGSMVREVLNNSPEMKHEFDGFTFFEDTTSVAPFTELSLLTTFIGHVPEETSNKDIREKYLPESFIHDSSTEGFSVSCYGCMNPFSKDVSVIPSYAFIGSEYFSESLIYRELWITCHSKLIPRRIQTFIDKYLINIVENLTEENAVHSSRLRNIIAADRAPAASGSLTYFDFEAYSNNINKSTSNRVLQFHHYLFSHNPCGFNRDGSYTLASKKPQDYSAAMDEAYFTITAAISLIKRLKEIGVYDNSLIIFTSDHGMEPSYQKTQDMARTFNTRWSVSRYNPFLMIKNFDQHGSLIHSPRKVSLLDIAPTICSMLADTNACHQHKFEGYSLLAPSPRERNRTLLIENINDVRDISNFNKINFPASAEDALKKYFNTDNYINNYNNPPSRFKGPLVYAKGLSVLEPSGLQWSSSKEVSLHFRDLLPEKLKLSFKARIFGPNTKEPFIIRVGNEERQVSLSQAEAEYSFEFTNVGNGQHDIVFTVPKPTAPSEISNSPDNRKLGIGFLTFSIEKI